MPERKLFYFKNTFHINDDISRDDFLVYSEPFDLSIGKWCYCTREISSQSFQRMGMPQVPIDKLHLVDELLEVQIGNNVHGCVL